VLNKPLSRTPPERVREILRREVNFGCPVPGCGSPFLSWHHFDPPWVGHGHHNPEGMIALCLQHHKEADGGAFTKQQLQEFKRKPFLQNAMPTGKFNWRREFIVLEVGSNYFISPHRILGFVDEGKITNVIWTSYDSFGLQSISLDLRRANGDPVLRMDKNDWIVLSDVDDVECPPSANSLNIEAAREKIKLNLRFSSLSKEQLHRRVNDRSGNSQFAQNVCNSVPKWPIALCTISGNIAWPIPIILEPDYTMLPGPAYLFNNFKIGGGIKVNKYGGFSF